MRGDLHNYSRYHRALGRGGLRFNNKFHLNSPNSSLTVSNNPPLFQSGSLSDGDNVNLSSPLVSKILDVILLMMSSNQSIHVMKMVFATQRSIITKV